MPRPLHLRLTTAAVAALVIGVVGCAPKARPAASPPPDAKLVAQAPPTTPTPAAPAPPPPSTVAQARGPLLAVFDAPGAGAPGQTFENPTFSGAPAVFLVSEQQGDWIKVLLPVRPNGATGWVRASDVTLTQHDFRIEVSLGQHQLRVYRGSEVIREEAVGVGTGGTPTPTGIFFTKELLQPPTPDGPYGAFAYGLSGFSEVLTSFGGGPGTIAIHGTNQPGALGTNVSHGCVRMSNEGIVALSTMLPLGVPVQIHQ